MTLDQIVNQKVERAYGALLIRQMVLESQVEELSKQVAESPGTDRGGSYREDA